jgi:hypothetical protein
MDFNRDCILHAKTWYHDTHFAEGYRLEERKKKKVWRRVLILTEEPEIAQLARQHFCSPLPSDKPVEINSEVPLTKVERASRTFDLLSPGLGIAAWFYAVISPQPNFYFGSFLFFAAVWFHLFALWNHFAWSVRGKIVSGICALLIFATADYMWHVKLTADANAAIERSQEDARKEVHRNLDAHLSLDNDDGKLEDPVFSYENDSNFEIKVAKITLGVNQLYFATFHLEYNQMFIVPIDADKKTVLEAGGGGETVRVLAQYLKHNRVSKSPFLCGDVSIYVDYTLSAQPNVPQSKQFRFVTRPTKGGGTWDKFPTNKPRNCPDTPYAPFALKQHLVPLQ